MIKTYPNPILRKKCEEILVEEIPSYEDLMKTMKEIIVDFDALGLATNQIGEEIRIIGISPRAEGNKIYSEPKFMINPKITKKTGLQIGPEACLSFPGVLTDIKRASWIKVKYLDQKGKEQTEELIGQEAIIVQHEIDHLDGITLIHSAPRVSRGQIMRKLTKGKRDLKKYQKRMQRLNKIGQELSKIDTKTVEKETK
jgi:peptide deformylase